ncbi:hypothetical protein F4810DRAFT_691920 [Camillea tinctor]|nr:hypothetical protein F4810DRAFT_691920 [Camillea tinctor]
MGNILQIHHPNLLRSTYPTTFDTRLHHHRHHHPFNCHLNEKPFLKMKTQSILATLAAAGTAFSAAIDVRQMSQYPVSNFSASCNPEGVCDYSFDMVTGMDLSTTCTGQSKNGSGAGTFGPVEKVSCADPKYAFSVEFPPHTDSPADDAPVLLIKVDVDGAEGPSSGSHPILKAEILGEVQGEVSVEKYTGPAEFAIAVVPVV